MNYKEDMEIDETSLDLELLNHTHLMFRYARYANRARKVFELAKETLAIVKAELGKGIRKDPKKYEVVKGTDGEVQEIIVLQDQYKEAYKNMIEKQYEARMAVSAAEAIEGRKPCIHYLVKLHGQQYFAGSGMSKDSLGKTNKFWREDQKRVDTKIAEAMRKNRKKGEENGI